MQAQYERECAVRQAQIDQLSAQMQSRSQQGAPPPLASVDLESHLLALLRRRGVSFTEDPDSQDPNIQPPPQ